MAIEFHCVQCSKLLRVPDETLGKRARCPHCGTICAVSRERPRETVESGPGSSHGVGERQNPFAESTRAPTTSQPENPYAAPVVMHALDQQRHRMDLASRGTRLGAAILDFFIVLLGAVVFGGIGAAIAYAVEPNDEDLIVLFMLVPGGVAALAISIVNWVMISTSGQSIAKRICGIRIVTESGDYPGFVRGVLLRIFVPALINQFCSAFGVIDVLWIFGAERRCLHDLIASTYVVDVD